MKFKYKQNSAIFLSLILSSCSLLGPDYNKPKIDTPSSWNNSVEVKEANLAKLAWWKKFNDPKLNQLIEEALQNNNDLQIAVGNILQADALLKQVQMGWVPTISLGGSGFAGQMFNPNVFAPNTTQNFNGYTAGFTPSYTLNVFSQIKNVEIAKLNIAMQKEAKNAVRLGVITQVAGSYFTLLGLHKQLEIQNQTIKDAEAMGKYYVLQYNAGKVSKVNIIGLNQYLSSLKSQIPNIQNNIVKTQNALQVLLNKNPGNFSTNNNFDNIVLDGVVPSNLPAAVLKNRPDVMGAEYQLQITNAKIGLAMTKFFPSINLTSNLGYNSIELANMFNSSGDYWFGLLNASMPLLDLATLDEIKEKKGIYYSAYYNYVKTIRNAFKEVDDGLSKNDSLRKVYAEQASGLNDANELYEIEMARYKEGAVAYSDTIGMKINIDYGVSALNQTKVEQLSSLVNLYQALGGGYMVESQLTQVKKFHDNHDI